MVNQDLLKPAAKGRQPDDVEASVCELQRHSTWMDLQDVHEMNHGQTFLPGFFKSFATDRTLTSIIYAKNRSCRSQLACSSDGKRYGLLCNAHLEIRELFGQKRAYRVGVMQDEFPQWCSLRWSSNNDLLFVAWSQPVVEVFDFHANYVFGIKLEQPSVVFDAAHAVSSMYCQRYEQKNWTDLLFILQYNGCLRCYKIGFSKGYVAAFTVQLSSSVAAPFTFVLGSPEASLLVTASAFVAPRFVANQTSGHQFGLNIWRHVDEEPYLVPFVQDESKSQSLTRPKYRFLGGLLSSKGFIVDLSMNAEETMLACITSLNDIFVCTFPSLRICNFFPASSLRDPWDKIGHSSWISPLGVDWWSSKELVVLFDNGSVLSQLWNEKEDAFSWRNCLHKFDHHCQRMGGNVGQQFFIETWKAFEGDVSLPLAPSIRSLILKLPYYYAKWLIYIFFGASSNPTDLATYAVNCTLWEMKSVNPVELITKKLLANDFENAAAIAKYADLSIMKICKSLWRQRDPKMDAIEKYLIHIDDKEWVLRQCLVKPSQHPDHWLRLLEYGITLSMELHLASRSDSSPYLRPLLKLSRRWVMLKDALEIGWVSASPAAVHPERMQMVSSLNPLSLAVQMALQGDCSAVAILLCRHQELLGRYWFYLLGCVHFSVKIKKMRGILPTADDALKWKAANPHQFPVCSTQVDFSDRALFGSKLKSDEDLLAVFPSESKPPCPFIDSDLPDRSSIVEWYQWRCPVVENYTGWPDYCLQLLNFAVCEGGLTELTPWRYEYYLVTVLVYSGSDKDLTHSTFAQLDPLKVANWLLRLYLDSAKLLEQFKQQVIPYLEYCQRQQGLDVRQMLCKLLVAESRTSLRTLCSVLCPADEYVLSLFNSCPEEYVSLLNDCLCSCEGALIADDVSELLLSAEKVQARCANVSNDYWHLLTLLRNELKAYRILQAAGEQCSFNRLGTVRHDSGECEKLLHKVVQSTLPEIIANGRNGLEAAIGSAHDFVRFGRLNIEPQMIVSILAKELLFSGDGKLLEEVEALIQTEPSEDPSSPLLLSPFKKLPYDDACRMVLEATRIYANQANNKASKILALTCISLIKYPCEELQREKCFLRALPILSKLGVSGSPEDLRPIVCNGDLIAYIFSQIPDAYKSLDDIQRVTDLLFPNTDARERAAVVSIRCAEQAILLGDMVHIVVYCNRILREKWTSGWQVCHQAAQKLLSGGRCPDMKDNFRQECARQFLEFSILNGQARYLESILRDFGKVSASLNDVEAMRNAKVEELNRRLFCAYSEGTDSANGGDKGTPGELQDVLEMERIVAGSALPLKEDEAFTMLTLIKNIGIEAVLTDQATAASVLLSLPTSQDVICCLQPYLHRADVAAFATYVMCLRLLMKNSDGKLSTRKLLQFDPASVIEFVLQRDTISKDSEEVDLIRKWMDSIDTIHLQSTLNKTHPEMDSEKFLADEEYRRETILGLALSTDKDNYETAVHLAEKFCVPAWDVQMDHLEYILTDSGLQPEEMMTHIKELSLLEKLSHRPEDFVARMEQNVFTMLEGKDYDRLQLYYTILKMYGQHVANTEMPRALRDASEYRIVLQNLKQHWIDVDFVKLLSSSPDDLTVLMPCLTAKNFLLIAKLIMKLPDKGITMDHMLALWALKTFLESCKKATAEEAVAVCGKTLDKLSDSSFLNLVRKILFSEDVANELRRTKFKYDSFSKAIEEYAVSKNRSESMMRELRKCATFTSNVEALMAKLPACKRVYVDAQLRPCGGDPDKVESILLEWLKDKRKTDIAKIALPIFSMSDANGTAELSDVVESKTQAPPPSPHALAPAEQRATGQTSKADGKESAAAAVHSFPKTKNSHLFASLVNEKDLRDLRLQGECLRKLVLEMNDTDQVEALIDFFAIFREKCLQSPESDENMYAGLFATFLDRAFRMHQRSSWPLFRSFVAKLVFTDCFDEKISELFYKILIEQKLYNHAALFALWFDANEDQVIDILAKGSQENCHWCSELITAVVKKKLVPRVTRTLFFDSLADYCCRELRAISTDQFDDLVGSVLVQLHQAGLEGELEVLLLALNSVSDSILVSFDSDGATFRMVKR